MIKEIIEEYRIYGKLAPDSIEVLYTPHNKLALIDFLSIKPNRELAMYLLNDAIAKREKKDYTMNVEDLMYASYLLAIHRTPEDSLLIWKAKEVDFDNIEEYFNEKPWFV